MTSCKFRNIFLCILFFVILCHSTYPQVANDAVNDRLRLELNTSVKSNTIKSTVQWNCIDEALTGRCIKYHNDQWFYFEVRKKGDYYINISNQQCRDLNGVQAVVIDGVPCEVETYKILKCYSDGKQDDIFIELKDLEPFKEYLLNIDGYLHDYCSFELEFSDVPRGLPIEKEEELNAELSVNKNTVILRWKITEEIAPTIRVFQVWKRKAIESKHRLKAEVSVERNALGQALLSYEYRDSLFLESPSSYKIVAISEKKNILIDELAVRRDSIILDESEENSIKIDLDYKKGTPLTILIFDAKKNMLLQNSQLLFSNREHRRITYYIGHQIKRH